MIKRLTTNTIVISLVLVMLFTIFSPVISYAISAKDIRAIINGTPYFDPDSLKNSCGVGGSSIPSTTNGTLSTGSTVYILGDSITEAASQAYSTAFDKKNLTTFIDASRSRSINGAGQTGNKKSGLDAVEADKEILKLETTRAIVIALGTNPSNTSTNVDSLIKAVRTYNPSAPIYWIDTIVINRPSYNNIIESANKTIYNGSKVNGSTLYTPISWFKTVSPGGDPTKLTGTEKDASNYINKSDGYNVHPTSAGSTALANLVVDTLTGGKSSTPENGGTCYNPVGSECSIAGGPNEEKIYNFFIGKGLTPIHAAAFLGNMQEEAHFEPRLVEYGFKNSRGEVSVPGSPTSLDDVPPPNQPNKEGQDKGQPGYGIIQWSGGRKQTLSDFAAASGKPVNSLCLQLDFVWSELNGPYKDSTLTPLINSTSVDIATEIITRHYEIPGGIDAAVIRRIANAKVWLTRFGSR